MKRYICCIILAGIAFYHLTPCPSPQERGELLRERIYVQTDKHLYLAGEPVLMKFLTTDSKQIPLVFSKVAYAELVADSIAQLQIKVALTNGTGTGMMQLPADLPTGYYRLIAYTQFMRNEGADVFFEKNIAVLNTFQSGYNPSTPISPVRNFTEDGVPFSWERLEVGLDKTTYTRRNHGELTINGLPENIHSLSVTIAGKDLVPNVETGLSLFQKNQTKNQTIISQIDYFPEFEGHIITGKIVENEELTNMKSTPTEPAPVDDLQENEAKISNTIFPVLAFPGEEIRLFAGQKSNTGDVWFFTSGISGMSEIATSVYNTGEISRVDIQSPFVTRFAPKQMPELHIDSAYYRQLLSRSVALQVFRYFSDDPSENRNIPKPHFKMKPSISYPLDEYTRFTTMREVFIEFIAGARFRRNAGKQEISVFTKRGLTYIWGTAPLVVLDGVPITNHDLIYNYNPLSVEKINIYYGPCALGGYRFDGVVELITYRRLHADLNLPKSTQIITYEGPQLPFQLDTPDYSEKNQRIWTPDSRHTLLWNPDVKTEGNTTLRLPFDTSDLTGEFQATVEGITKDGKIVFTTSSFRVER